jgi:DNA-binding CsgD family transcriptional regulator
MRWGSFVLAPVVVNAASVALLHADHPRAGPVDALDRDVLWEFASGLACAYESAGLRRLLRRERHALRDLLKWLEIRSEELTDSLIELAAPTDSSRQQSTATTGGLLEPGMGEGLLTPRELEILRMMSEGRTNRSIADELVIANGTVKFHVHHILRKLHVANRAQAVSRYLALLDVRASASQPPHSRRRSATTDHG